MKFADGGSTFSNTFETTLSTNTYYISVERKVNRASVTFFCFLIHPQIREKKFLRVKFIVSPDKSRGYLGFSTVTPPPQRFPFGRDNLKNILVRTFKFGMWVYMGNATNAIVL